MSPLNRRQFITGIGAAVVASRTRAAGRAFQSAREWLKSAKSGSWSSPATWGGRVPAQGDFVQIQPGHEITYDAWSEDAIRMVHIQGALSFARDRNTRLDAGLIKI